MSTPRTNKSSFWRKKMEKKTRLIGAKRAGQNHQVMLVESNSRAYRRAPCDTCPWRKDAAGEFPAEAFRLSASTGTDGAFFSPSVLRSFACHSSGIKTPATCAGYILRGYEAIGWRIALITGMFDPAKVSSQGLDLFGSYFEMAVANGVSPDDPVLAGCKPWRMSAMRPKLSRKEDKNGTGL
jgi:hypothetical protein